MAASRHAAIGARTAEEHRTVEPCRSCHKIMDPIGLALENFDAIGAGDRGTAAIRSMPPANSPTARTVDGPVALRQALLQYSDAYVTNLTAKLLAYGLGRVTPSSDMPFVRQIVKRRRAGSPVRVDCAGASSPARRSSRPGLKRRR